MNCPICVTDISSLELNEQLTHCNKCLDGPDEEDGDEKEPIAKECPICGKFNGNHVLHIKSCARDNYLNPRQLMDLINKSVDQNASQFPALIDFKPKKVKRVPKDAPKVAKDGPKDAQKTRAPRKRTIKREDGSTLSPVAKKVAVKKKVNLTMSKFIHTFNDGANNLDVAEDVEDADDVLEDPLKSRRVKSRHFKDVDADKSPDKKVVSIKSGIISRVERLTKDVIKERIMAMINEGSVVNKSLIIVSDGDEEFDDDSCLDKDLDIAIDEMPIIWLLSSLTIGSRSELSFVARDFNRFVASSSADAHDYLKDAEDKKKRIKDKDLKPVTFGYCDPVQVVAADEMTSFDDSAFLMKKINSMINNPKFSDLIIKLEGDKHLNSHLFLWKLSTKNHELITKQVKDYSLINSQSSCLSQRSSASSQDKDIDKDGVFEVNLSRFKRSSVICFLKYVYTGKILIASESKDDFVQLINYVGADERLINKFKDKTDDNW